MSAIASLILLALTGLFVRRVVLPPAGFPKNIPTIPFWVSFVPVFYDIDQQQLFNLYFREKLEKFGAVKVYFASQWNVLVTRPDYVAQVFKESQVFEKSGNNKKIPHTVVAEYLGDNIILASTANWKVYREVMTNSILFPDLSRLGLHVDELVESLTQALVAGPVVVGRLLQKFTLACIGDCVLGCSMDRTLGTRTLYDHILYLKSQIFRPIFMNFPVLEHLPLPSRRQARSSVHEFKNLLTEYVERSHESEPSLRLGSALCRALEEGKMTRKQTQDNLMIALVAGHENPQLLLTNVLYLLAQHVDIQTKLRDDLRRHEDPESSYLLHAVVYESLRMYPPLGQLINRKTTRDVVLGGAVHVPANTYVGVNSFFTQHDRTVWPDADNFQVSRWGSSVSEATSTFTLAKSRCALTAFHGRQRACLGEKFALAETRKAVAAVVERFSFTLDAKWQPRITLAGPIWPPGLSLVLKEEEKFYDSSS